jgi:hypothetical protein
LISLPHSQENPATATRKQGLSGGDAVLREIIEEMQWIEASQDTAERERRLRWLGTEPISPSSRFALRLDRDGFVISFVQFGNAIHPMGWTINRKRARSYRGLQQRSNNSWLGRIRQSVASMFRPAPDATSHVTAAK